MGATARIAKHLGISSTEAAQYCEQVRLLSGLGSKLSYQTIFMHMLTIKHPKPTPEELADAVRHTKHHPIQAQKQQRKLPGPQEKVSIYERFDGSGGFGQHEPSPMSAGLTRRSLYDRQRVLPERLEHCPHGVPKGQICAICNPREFRQMTGID
jgi:hypothetical protein